jgi:hypothetical protein
MFNESILNNQKISPRREGVKDFVTTVKKGDIWSKNYPKLRDDLKTDHLF